MTKHCRLLRRANEIDPSDIWVWYYRSFILAKQEKNDEAVKSADIFLAAEPDHADIWTLKGISQYKTGHAGEAVESLKQALDLNPEIADAWFYLGLAYTRLDEYPDAVDAFTKNLDLNPSSAPAYYHRGIAYLRQKKYREAVPDFDQSLSLSSRESRCLVQERCCLHPPEQVRGCAGCVQQGPRHAAGSCRDRSITRDLPMQNWAGSRNRLSRSNRSLSLIPGALLPPSSRDLSYANLGRFAEAVTAYDQALQISPDYTDALYHKGFALAKAGKE